MDEHNIIDDVIRNQKNYVALILDRSGSMSALPFFGGESPYIVDATPTSGTSGASDQSECSPLG